MTVLGCGRVRSPSPAILGLSSALPHVSLHAAARGLPDKNGADPHRFRWARPIFKTLRS